MTELTLLEQQKSIIDDLQQQLRPELPVEIENWLGRLALLYGVPFGNLVPDARMLPVESIRFFYVDSNWLEALVDGAFSIGVHSDRDIRYHKVMQYVIREATDVASGKLRPELRGEEIKDVIDSDKTEPEAARRDNRIRAGFLLRSTIVSGWPGLEICGYKTPEENEDNKLALLRLERLAPDLMLCIFEDIPALLVVNEPAEDFHFGITLTDDETYKLPLRNPETGSRNDSQNRPLDQEDIPFRDDDPNVKGVIDVAALHASVQQKLTIHKQNKRINADLGQAKANFAVQLIDAADKQVFRPPLFSVEMGLIDELNTGQIPADLAAKFLANGIELGSSAEVTVDAGGGNWTIKDGETQYLIRTGQGVLHILQLPAVANQEGN